jgi:predicted membrane chloride channel (bestrophin family)
MPKVPKPKKQATKSREFYGLHPWQCRHHKDCSEITAYVEASGWEKVLTVHPTSGASAEAVAQFLCDLVNDNRKNKSLLHDAMAALEQVLNDGLNFSTEQAADRVVTRIKARVS